MIFRKKDRAARRLLAGLVKDRSGATAIEFAMLAIPFSLLVFAILESCISFAAQQLLVNATDDVAREIRTGQLRPDDLTGGKLKKMICERIEIIVASGCPGLSVDLETFGTFEQAADAVDNIKLTGGGEIDTDGFGDTPGGPTTKNMLRVFYEWPIITDFLRNSMSNLDNGKTLLFATTTWQNEPFDD